MSYYCMSQFYLSNSPFHIVYLLNVERASCADKWEKAADGGQRHKRFGGD